MKAENRVEDHVDPEDRVHGGHDEEGRDQQDPDDALSWESFVDQHGDQDTEDDRQEQNAADDEKAVLNGKQEVLALQNEFVIPEAAPVAEGWGRPFRAAKVVQHIPDEREIKCHAQRDKHPDQEQDDCRCLEQTWERSIRHACILQQNNSVVALA